MIDWIPGISDIGDHPVTVQATDPGLLSASESFTVTVFEQVQDTVQLSDPGNFTLVVGETLEFNLQAASSNPTADLAFSKQDGPPGLTIDATTGEVTWTTNQPDLGTADVRARVTDQNGLFDEQAFIVEVTESIDTGQLDNRAPALEPIDNRTVDVGQSLSIQTVATDPDSDPLSYELLAAPSGMTIDTNGLITFTPSANQDGPYSVNVRVSDPLDLSDSTTFVVTVNGLNDPPIALDDTYDAQRGTTLSIPAAGVLENDTDPNGDPLTAALVDAPNFGDVTVNPDGSFEYTPDNPAGSLVAVEKFRFETFGTPIEQPLIADMNDNGTPDIVYHIGPVLGTGALGAVDGGTLQPIFEVEISREIVYDKLVADIDSDGRMEIVLIGAENGFSGTQYGKKLIALEHDGQLKWISEALPEIYFRDDRRIFEGDFREGKLSIADLDQDGAPEIVVGWGSVARTGPNQSIGYSVFDHQGMLIQTVQGRGIKSPGRTGRVEIVDLDLDGDPEILTGSAAFSHTGELLWERDDEISSNIHENSSLIAANLDDDPYPELIRRDGNRDRVLVWNHDGTDLWDAQVPPAAVNFDPALVVADVNNDGVPDILVAASNFSFNNNLTVLNGVDGSTLWSIDVPGQVRSSAPTVLDMDRDGVNEVIMPYDTGPATLLVLDGRDGSIKRNEDQYFGNGPNGSGSPHMPIFADIDNDGASELIVIGRGEFGPGSSAFYIFESENDDWPPNRGIWNQWSYHVTNINEDGSVPQFEQPHWLLPGLNSNRINERLPEEREEDFDQFTYAASDGDLSDEATVYLRVLTNSNPPQFLSQPDNSATVNFDYRYAPIVNDPDPGETFTFELTAAPPGMTIDPATGLIRWRPTATGDYNIGVAVSDSADLSAVQTWTLTVGEPVEVPDVVGQLQATAENTLIDADLSIGLVREAFSTAFPSGQVSEQSPIAGSVAEFGEPINLIVSLGAGPADTDNDNDGFTENEGDCNDADDTIFPGATDPEGDGIDQNCDGFDGVLALESIELTPSESIVLSNRIIEYEAIGITEDGTAVNLNGLGDFNSSDTNIAQQLGDRRIRSAAPGTATISLMYLGVTGEAAITVVNGVSSDNEPPIAEITSPISAQEVTAPIEVIGTANDANLLRWELWTRAGENSEPTLLSRSTTAVSNGVLGELDPTLLLNGVQTLILRVFDRGENVSEARVSVAVAEDFKIGNFTLTFEDLNVALASLPITMNRTYDSRDKRRGDFGIGWNLGLRTVEVRTNRVLGTGWEVLGGGTGFQLNSTDDHLVTVTLPGGEVETFELRITPNTSFLVPFSFVTASLEPIGDTLGELTLLDNSFLVIVDGQPGPVQLLDDSSLNVFNPQRFRYVAPNGLAFVINRNDGLESFSDTNGNMLTFTENAIIHSNGTEVQFLRDELGRISRLTDPTGNQQFYKYDSNGDLAAHTDAEGNVTRFRYDARHNLLEFIDPRGNRAVRNEYDDDGRLTAIIDAEGHRIEFTSDIDGREQLIRDANGNVQRLLMDDNGNVLVRERTVTIDGVLNVAIEQYEYDERGNMLVQIDADGIRSEMTWDDDDNLMQTVVDPGGLNLTTSSTYDQRNNRLTETDAMGHVTSYTYDEDDNVLTITDPLGGVTRFSYTGAGKISTLTDPIGTVTVYSYDNRGQLIQEDINQADGTLLSRKTYTFDNVGRRLTESQYRVINDVLSPLTTSYEYDSNGRQIAMTDPLDNVSRTEYDAAGNISAQIDALGRRIEFSYNSRGQQIQTSYPDGTTTGQTYDPAGNVISRTDELGRVTSYEFDELNRQIAIVYPDGAREEEVFSEGGQMIATIDANGNRTDFIYDSAGRQVNVIAPEVIDARDESLVQPTISQSYDAAGRVITTTDANGHATSFTYDARGRLTRTDNPDGTFTAQGFDAAGRVTSMTDELGRITDYVYDGLGQLLSVAEPAPEVGQPRPITAYTWDLTGNRLTETDALGRTTSMNYDALGRQIRRTLPGGQFATNGYDEIGNVTVQTNFNGQSVAFEYDARNRLIERVLPDGEVHGFTYSPTGARLTLSDSNGTQTFTYDLRDRLVGLNQADGSSLSYQFDPAGNLIQTATADQTIDYRYDAMNRMLESATGSEITGYGYDPNGNQVVLTRPNLSVTEQTFDSRNRILSILHKNESDTVLESFVNAYRENGQRIRVTESDGSVETYTYDDLDRLVLETRTGTTPRTVEYRYDIVGNRIEISQDGVIRSATYDQNDRLLSDGTKSFTYDANGNRTSANDDGLVRLLNWNSLNWLTSVEQQTGTTTYRYNADAERIATEQDTSGIVRYLIDPQNGTGFSQIKESRDGAGEIVEQFSYGNDLISRDDVDEGLRYFHTDALGSTRLLTDEANQATDRYNYTGYGVLANRTGSSDNAHLYTGERLQSETGDYYLRARYYDPSLGQFLSRDPFTGMPTTPVTMRPYLYASVDPINNIDPLGLFTIAEINISSYFQQLGRVGQAIQACNSIKRAQAAADVISFLSQLAVTQGFGASAGETRINRGLPLPKSFGDDARLIYSYIQNSANPFEASARLMLSSGGVAGVAFAVNAQYQGDQSRIFTSLEPFAEVTLATLRGCSGTFFEFSVLYRPLMLQVGQGSQGAGNIEGRIKLFNAESRFSVVSWDSSGLSLFGYPINP